MYRDKIRNMTNAELNSAVAKEVVKYALVIVGSTIAFKVAVRLIAGPVTNSED